MLRTSLFLFIIAFSAFLFGCGSGEPEDIDLDAVELRLKTHRLDETLYQASQVYKKDTSISDLEVYQQHLAPSRKVLVEWLFGGRDSLATPEIIASQIGPFLDDPSGFELLDTLQKAYPADQWSLEETFTNPMKRFRHYFPQKAVPAFFTYVDGFPPSATGEIDQVFLSPQYIGIGLHYFLGPNYHYYPNDLPMFIRRRCNRDHIAPVVIRKMAFAMVPEPEITGNPVLVDYVVNAGIRMYLIDKLLGPKVEDTLKILYTAPQWTWATTYESRLYKEMLPELYTVDPGVIRRYQYDSPFTSQLSRESAPRAGEYIGWQIVKAYMKKHPDTSLDELAGIKDFQKLFQEASYRPPRPSEE